MGVVWFMKKKETSWIRVEHTLCLGRTTNDPHVGINIGLNWDKKQKIIVKKNHRKSDHVSKLVVPLGFKNWITVSSLKMLTSSICGIAFTPILFKVLCSLLSSVVVVLCTAFFFLHVKITPQFRLDQPNMQIQIVSKITSHEEKNNKAKITSII